MLTEREVAADLCKSLRQVRRYRALGWLRSISGTPVTIDSEDLAAFKEFMKSRHKAAPTPTTAYVPGVTRIDRVPLEERGREIARRLREKGLLLSQKK
jgi:hypothetical protein